MKPESLWHLSDRLAVSEQVYISNSHTHTYVYIYIYNSYVPKRFIIDITQFWISG
jgi:hypothetical protein